MPLGPTIILKTKKSISWQRNPENNFLKRFRSLTHIFQGINPMGLCATWAENYIHNLKPNYFNHQTNWIVLVWWLEVSQSINDKNRKKNWHPCHDLPQKWGGSKSVFTVWMCPTDDFITHQSTGLRINEWWCSKWKTQNSKIKNKALNEEIEGSFLSSKAINCCKQVWISNRNPQHDLPQTCGGSK